MQRFARCAMWSRCGPHGYSLSSLACLRAPFHAADGRALPARSVPRDPQARVTRTLAALTRYASRIVPVARHDAVGGAARFVPAHGVHGGPQPVRAPPPRHAYRLASPRCLGAPSPLWRNDCGAAPSKRPRRHVPHQTTSRHFVETSERQSTRRRRHKLRFAGRATTFVACLVAGTPVQSCRKEELIRASLGLPADSISRPGCLGFMHVRCRCRISAPGAARLRRSTHLNRRWPAGGKP